MQILDMWQQQYHKFEGIIHYIYGAHRVWLSRVLGRV